MASLTCARCRMANMKQCCFFSCCASTLSVNTIRIYTEAIVHSSSTAVEPCCTATTAAQDSLQPSEAACAWHARLTCRRPSRVSKTPKAWPGCRSAAVPEAACSRLQAARRCCSAAASLSACCWTRSSRCRAARSCRHGSSLESPDMGCQQQWVQGSSCCHASCHEQVTQSACTNTCSATASLCASSCKGLCHCSPAPFTESRSAARPSTAPHLADSHSAVCRRLGDQLWSAAALVRPSCC